MPGGGNPNPASLAVLVRGDQVASPTADRRPPTADRRPPTADRRPPTADRRNLQRRSDIGLAGPFTASLASLIDDDE
jgi:hypothetical protein